MEGFGKWTFEGDELWFSKYEGNFKNGNFEGLGRMIYANGDIYKGEWNEGKRSGKGFWKSLKGDYSYEGDWKNGLPDGFGIMIYKNGTREQGKFKDGKLLKFID